MSVKTRKLAELLAKEAKGTNVLNKREQDDLRQLMERLDVDIAAARNTLTKVVNTTELISLTTKSEVTFSSGGTVDLGGYTLDLGANFTTTGGALQLTSSGSYTLTIAGNASVTGTNTGDDSLATNSGLVLTSHVLNMGTPQSVTSASTNNVTTSTHGHEADSTLARSAINMTAGNGFAAGSGGNLTADRTFTLGTPTTLTVSTTNAVTTNSHVHTITSSASVTGETETLLATDSSGVVRLYRVGIGTAPDAQYDLDVAGSIHTSSYFVGRHAIEVKGALMLCHYDGERPWETNFTGEVTGHMGQVGNKAGGLIFRPGAFYKGAQIAEAATNHILYPSAETGSPPTGWGLWSGSATVPTRDATISKYGLYGCRLTYTYGGSSNYVYAGNNIWNSIAASAGQAWSFSIDVYVVSASAGAYAQLNIIAHASGGGVLGSATANADMTKVGEWQRVSVTYPSTPATTVYINTVVKMGTASSTIVCDASQCTPTAYALPYLDGSLGDGHAWTGTAHASTSTRTAATLYYANPLVAAEGTIQLHWIPSSANTTAQTSPYLFSEGNLKAYYLAADDKIYFTDGTNTISTDALTFSADLPQFLAFSWSSAGLEIKRYYNSTMDTTVTGATYTAPTLGTNLYIGSDTAGANQCNGIIDDLGVIDHLYTDAEFLAIAKSDGPIFAETSTWAFRFGYNRGWSDVDGLWVIDSDSNAVFGVYGGASTKTWGGFTLAPGDLVIGNNVANMSAIRWDQSTGKFGFYGNASATVQCEIDTDGSLTAGEGAITLNAVGITINSSGAYTAAQAINFYSSAALHSIIYDSVTPNSHDLTIRSHNVNLKASDLTLVAVANATFEANSKLQAYSGEIYSELLLYADSNASPPTTYARLNTRLNMSDLLAINTNSTTALLVEQDGVKDNVLVVNTTIGGVGVNAATPRQQLSVGAYLDLYSGAANTPTVPSIRGSSSNNLVLNGYSTGGLYLNYDGGTGGIHFHGGTSTEVGSIDSSGNMQLDGYADIDSYIDAVSYINTADVYKVDGVQVVGNQIVDERIDDNISEAAWGTSEANVLKALRAWATTWGAVVPS